MSIPSFCAYCRVPGPDESRFLSARGMLYTAYREDCDQLEKLGVALPSERFFPTRDFQSTSSEKLLSTRPSFAVCAMLWTDLLEASHSERHKPVAGRGRACRCPLWTPEHWRSWNDEIDFLRDRHGLSTEDLGRVLDTVFGQPDSLSNKSGRSVLQLVYENNWIWYTRASFRHLPLRWWATDTLDGFQTLSSLRFSRVPTSNSLRTRC